MKNFVGITLLLLSSLGYAASEEALSNQFGSVIKLDAPAEVQYRKSFCGHASNSLEKTHNQVMINIFNCESAKFELRMKDKVYTAVVYVKSFYGNKDLTVYAPVLTGQSTGYGQAALFGVKFQ
jgi:hypothetical protein